MNYKVLFNLFFFIICSNLSAQEQAKVYGLLTQNGFCSATLLKSNGICSLVTNAHCIQTLVDQIQVISAKNYMPAQNNRLTVLQKLIPATDVFNTNESTQARLLWSYEQKYFGQDEEIKTSIISFDRTKDLALLALPESIKNEECPNLNQPTIKTNEVLISGNRSVIIAGFTAERKNSPPKPKVWHNRNTIRNNLEKAEPTYNPSSLSLSTSTLPNIDKFLEVDTRSLEGHSGGMAIDEKGNFLGLSTRYIESQDTAFIIPVADVINYINNPTQNNESLNGNNQSKPSGGSNGGDTQGGSNGGDTQGGSNGADTQGGSNGGDTQGGSNGGDTQGGSNGGDTQGGSNGGDTQGGSNGGDTQGGSNRSQIGCVHPSFPIFMNSFIDSNDGFLNHVGKIILAVDGHQINGSDDLKDHWDPEGNIIYVEDDNYPTLAIRKGIIERLLGEYTFLKSSQKQYIENEDESFLKKWRETHYGEGKSSIKLEKESIKLEIEETGLYPSTTNFFTMIGYQLSNTVKKDYKISFDSSYKTVYLESIDEKLTCKNNNYLKLICTGQGRVLSISTDSTDTRNRKTNFRYNEYTERQNRYFYGSDK